MFFIQVLCVVLALVAGLAVMYLCKWIRNTDASVSWVEYGAVSLVMVLAIIPAVGAIGSALSIADQLTRYQWVNGTDEEVRDSPTVCRVPQPSRFAGMNNPSSGSTNCTHYYDSGKRFAYEEEVCKTDSKGNRDCDIIRHRRPIYHPYGTVEHRYSIMSSMGKAPDGRMEFTFPAVYLDANPMAPAGTIARPIPQDIPRGAPADWLAAKARKEAGDPRAATKLVAYEDPILAVNDTLKAYSSDREKYQKAGLLPDHTVDINSDPRKGASKSEAWKVGFANVQVADEPVWQEAVMRFNAALGMQLQGDLHVVLVDASQVPSVDSSTYVRALKMHWQDDAVYGKRTIAKNAIILALGVTPGTSTVAWADATTGMPGGNNVMIEYLKMELAGKPLDPGALFGKPITVVHGNEYTVALSTPRGVVESIVFERAPFKRASMTCKSSDDTCIGYDHLVQRIEPSAGAKITIVIITFVIAIGFWAWVSFTSFLDVLFASVFRLDSRPGTTTRPTEYPYMRSDRSRMNRPNERNWR